MSERPVFETDEGELAPPDVLWKRSQLPPGVLYLEDDTVHGRLSFMWRGHKYWYQRVERMLHGARVRVYKLILQE